MKHNPASLDDATPEEWDRASKKARTSAQKAFVELQDEIDAPPHYNNGLIECVDAIQESMSPEAFKGYCKGNALKYIWRMSYKGKPVTDLRKAMWYIDRLIDTELAYPTEIFDRSKK